MGDFAQWLGLKKAPGIDAVISWRSLIAEYLGTLLLVFMGTMLAVAPGSIDPIAGPFAGGLALASIIQAIGHVSGAHINPAMSLGFFVARRMSLLKALAYMLAQCVGAISGTAILKAITPKANHGTMGATALNPDLAPAQGFAIEIVITFILVFMTVSSTDPLRKDVIGSLPLAIGVYVTGAALAAGSFTGASMNPARSLGPAVIGGFWEHHWIYWAGPMFGGALAGIIHSTLFEARFLQPAAAQEVKDSPQEEESDAESGRRATSSSYEEKPKMKQRMNEQETALLS